MRVERDNTSVVIADIRDERCRQIHTEGWTPDHDDRHDRGEMADAAVCYIARSWPKMEFVLRPIMRRTYARYTDDPNYVASELRSVPRPWPWSPEWWKPKDRRSDLVRAAALIVAEIERIDRAAQPEDARHD